MCTASRKFKERENRLETGDHRFDMVSNFASPCGSNISRFGSNFGNKLRVRDDTRRGEQAICNGILPRAGA